MVSRHIYKTYTVFLDQDIYARHIRKTYKKLASKTYTQDISTRHIKKCLLRHIRLVPRHIPKTYTGDIFAPRHIHKTYTLFVRHIHMVSWEYVLQTLNMSWIPLNMSSRCRLRYMSREYVLQICLVTRLYMSCVYVFCAQDIYKYVLGDEYVLRYVCQDIFVDTYMSCEYVLCQTRVCRC